MAKYRVLVRKEIIAETWVEVEAGGCRQAEDRAVAKAHEDKTLMWINTETLNRQPYAVTYERAPVITRRKNEAS